MHHEYKQGLIKESDWVQFDGKLMTIVYRRRYINAELT